MKIGRQRWGNSKPPPSIGIDWSNTLTRGLIGCWLFNEENGVGSYNLVNNQKLIQTTAGYVPTWGLNPGGTCRKFDGSDDRLDYPNNTFAVNIAALSITAGICLNGPGSSNEGNIITKGYDAVSWGFKCYAANSLAFTAYFNPTAMLTYASNAFVNGAYTVVSATWDGSVTASLVGIYSNGIALSHVADTNGSGSRGDDSSYPIHIGNSAFLNKQLDGSINFIYIHNRQLTSTEVRNLHAAPYDIMQPVSTIKKYYYVAAGGGLSIPVAMNTYRQRRRA